MLDGVVRVNGFGFEANIEVEYFFDKVFNVTEALATGEVHCLADNVRV